MVQINNCRKKILVLLTLIISICACTTSNDNTVKPTDKPVETIKTELTIRNVPSLLPDILNLRNKIYEDMPYFDDQQKLSEYALWNFLNGDLGFECRVSRELAPYESGEILEDTCLDTMAYFLFSSYKPWDMIVIDDGNPDSMLAKVKIVFDEPEYDMEARFVAYKYVMEHPVPEGGFTSFEQEKEYARSIHDYIALKVTYDPVGFQLELPVTQTRYELFQEAYNVLGEDQKTCICAGYARAFALICQYAGINCAWIWGNQTEIISHAWNIIYPCDGSEMVMVDVTWDDTPDGEGQTSVAYDYFYIPVSLEYEHVANERMLSFIEYLNDQTY